MVRITVLMLTGMLAGCTDGPVSPTPDEDPELSDAMVTINEVIPTIVNVQWDANFDGMGWVEYGIDDAMDLSTPEVSGSSFDIDIMGLKAGGTYSMRSVSETVGGERLEGLEQTVTLDPPPQGMPIIQLTDFVPEQSEMTGKFVLLSIMEAFQSWVVILDHDGDYVWHYEVPPELNVVTAKIGKDRQSVIWAMYDRDQLTDVGNITRLSMDGAEMTVSRTLLGHHDFWEHEDGTLAWLAFDIQTGDLGEGMADIYGDRILEAPEGIQDGEQPSAEPYNYFEHYLSAPWWVCNHVSIEEFGGYGYEWTHTNSLVYDPDDDAYYILTRFLDALLKIDRTSGQVLWQLGGLYNQFGGMEGDDFWSHGHLSHLWDGGMVVFDNGNHSGQHSRIVEYAWDVEASSVQKVWDYEDPEGRFVEILGDVKKLPGGNYLASWTSGGFVNEITPEKEVVWRVEANLGAVTTRVTIIEDIYAME